jgi:ketosteroid isomerase-like protein
MNRRKPAQARVTSQGKSRQSAGKILDAYKDAVFAKDTDSFVGLYATNARIFDTWGRWSYDRLAAWRKMAARWFKDLGTERVLVSADERRTIMAGNIAVIHAFVTYTAVSAEGRKIRAMSNRLTWVLKRSGLSWKITHEHTSVPVDPATGQGILQR